MDILALFLAVVLAGLAAILAGVGAASARRYSDARLGLVASGLAVLALVGGLDVLHEVSPRYGGPFRVDPIPLGLIVLAVALLYLALVRGARRPPTS